LAYVPSITALNDDLHEIVRMDAVYDGGEDLAPSDKRWGEVPRPLSDLAILTSALVVRWESLTDRSRLSLIRQLQQLATRLGREIRMNGENGHADADVQTERLLFLTPRELDVLRFLADGASTDHVAAELLISKATVRSHVKSLLAKLGVHSRVEAVSLFLRHDATAVVRIA
jgi:DNA-binding CsgD family transcriptional regulator